MISMYHMAKKTISKSQCKKSFDRFKSGNSSLEDKLRRDRPSSFKDHKGTEDWMALIKLSTS